MHTRTTLIIVLPAEDSPGCLAWQSRDPSSQPKFKSLYPQFPSFLPGTVCSIRTVHFLASLQSPPPSLHLECHPLNSSAGIFEPASSPCFDFSSFTIPMAPSLSLAGWVLVPVPLGCLVNNYTPNEFCLVTAVCILSSTRGGGTAGRGCVFVACASLHPAQGMT